MNCTKGASSRIVSQRALNPNQVSILSEVRYVIRRAINKELRVVSLGPLIFFSTETGDAWVLDHQDKLALCLARCGDEQPFAISETATNFKIGWEGKYQICDDVFMFIANTGQSSSIIGYPVQEIEKHTRFYGKQK